MKFYELSHIGGFHLNHNEDYSLIAEAGKSRMLIAVMDGCSSGSDSYFASTLIGKLLRKIAKEESYREYATRETPALNSQLEKISLKLFDELVLINRQLDLKSDELLSTIILGLIDTEEKSAELLIVGDGYIHVNGAGIEYDNDNKPDYIGYHLNEEKDLWYSSKTEKLSVEKIKDLTISTDGIHTFRNFDGKSYDPISESEIHRRFFEDLNDLENSNKLKKVFIDIESVNGLRPSDDLSMIRVINA